MHFKYPSWLSKVFPLSKSGKSSLWFLNFAQSLGVVNDNLFKFAMVFLLIDTLGKEQASVILSATGAIYVIPFLLFSSSAGILADRFSKQKLLIALKCTEVIITLLSIFAFSTKSIFGCYTLLFLLATHSAMFGPSKYGIIPELVPQSLVSKANGLITSFTYLAIIIGTFLASFLTEMTNRNFPLIAIICCGIAILGCLSALGIKQTPAQGSLKTMNIFFIREIYYTLKDCRLIYHLLPVIFGSSFFLLLGAFTQLNIIPFALQALKLQEVSGGYLFLVTALGIAIGSFFAGKTSRKRIELGIPCLAGFGIALCFLLLALTASHLIPVIFCLIAIGILGGFFIVPFDTFIQLNSATIKRGQTIAAANFLSFTGVFFASFALYLFNQVFAFSSAGSFALMGVITLLIALLLTARLSDLAFPYFARKILIPMMRYRSPDVKTVNEMSNCVLILEKFSWKKALLLAGSFHHIQYYIPENSPRWHAFLRLFYNIYPIPFNTDLADCMPLFKEALIKDKTPCLLLEKTLPPQPATPNKIIEIFTKEGPTVVFAHLIKDPKEGSYSASFVKSRK